MIYRYDTYINPEIKYVYSIDPGFKTSGFTFLDMENQKVELWSSPKNVMPIMGLPFPDLLKMSIERTKYYVSQIPMDTCKNLEVIIEYTSLGLQFSTSLNVLVGVFASHLISFDGCARITFVPPKTSHWMVKKRKVSVEEMRNKALSTFPVKEWLKDGYKINAHTIDSLMFASFCHSDFFVKLGCNFSEFPQKKEKKGFIYVY